MNGPVPDAPRGQEAQFYHQMYKLHKIRQRRIGRWHDNIFCALLVLFCSISLGVGRTLTLEGEHIERMAAITNESPLLSWPGDKPSEAKPSAEFISLAQGRSFLFCFSLSAIPQGQRIIQAELLVPVTDYHGATVRFFLWRMLADWGDGVCHLYRTVSPQQLAWTRPGARGYASDRAARPSAIVRLNEKGSQAINVTEDLELWYAGAAANKGWLFTVEDLGSQVQLLSPRGAGARSWKLRITYEPK